MSARAWQSRQVKTPAAAARLLTDACAGPLADDRARKFSSTARKQQRSSSAASSSPALVRRQALRQAGVCLGAGTGSRSWSAVSVVVARARRERQNTQHAVIYTRPRPHTPDIYIYIYIYISRLVSLALRRPFFFRVYSRGQLGGLSHSRRRSARERSSSGTRRRELVESDENINKV